MNNKICLIIPYFGYWPSYIDIFLHSAGNNPSMDVVIFTDMKYEKKIPSNVKFVFFTLDQFNEIASKKIGFDIYVKNPYKLCDFKPCYGLIFSEYICEYSHWAFGDMDLIYGKIFNLLPENWHCHDILTFRKEWVSGSFTILRNSNYINTLYQKSIFCKEALTFEGYFGFDECSLLYKDLALKESDMILSIDKKQSFSWLVRNENKKGLLNIFQERRIKESINPDEYIFYKNGRILQEDGKEHLLYHYITEKKTARFSFPSWKVIPETFYIDRYGFFDEREFFSFRRNLTCFLKEIKFFSNFFKKKFTRLKNIAMNA